MTDATYMPNIPLAYWSFRLMIGVGMLAALVALRRPLGDPRGTACHAVRQPLGPALDLGRRARPADAGLRHSFGWIFTETGRQPWLVFGVMTTATGVSPSVSAGEVLTSMVVFTLLYGALAVVEIKLFLHYVRKGAEAFVEPIPPDQTDDDAPLVFAY